MTTCVEANELVSDNIESDVDIVSVDVLDEFRWIDDIFKIVAIVHAAEF